MGRPCLPSPARLAATRLRRVFSTFRHPDAANGVTRTQADMTDNDRPRPEGEDIERNGCRPIPSRIGLAPAVIVSGTRFRVKSRQRVPKMCLLCANGIYSPGDEARRLYVLELLALIEHPDALPHGAALRLSREIMALIDLRANHLRCHPVTPDDATGEDS